MRWSDLGQRVSRCGGAHGANLGFGALGGVRTGARAPSVFRAGEALIRVGLLVARAPAEPDAGLRSHRRAGWEVGSTQFRGGGVGLCRVEVRRSRRSALGAQVALM